MVAVRVETGSGHPGHILCGSTRSDLDYKISGKRSEPNSALTVQLEYFDLELKY